MASISYLCVNCGLLFVEQDKPQKLDAFPSANDRGKCPRCLAPADEQGRIQPGDQPGRAPNRPHKE